MAGEVGGGEVGVGGREGEVWGGRGGGDGGVIRSGGGGREAGGEAPDGR